VSFRRVETMVRRRRRPRIVRNTERRRLELLTYVEAG
jgi:hypothetical protein